MTEQPIKAKRVLMLMRTQFPQRPYRQAKTLASAGYDVIVIAYDPEKKFPLKEIVDGIRVERIRYRSTLLDGLNKFLNFFGFWLICSSRTMKKSFDVVHVNDIEGLSFGWMISRVKKTRLVYDSQELYFNIEASFLRQTAFRILERLFIGDAHVVTAVSESCAKALAGRYGIKQPKVIMNVPETVSIKKRDIRGELGIPTGKKIVIYVGDVKRGRGLKYLVESMAYLEEVYVVIIGRLLHGFDKMLSERAQALGVGDRLRILPAVPYQEMLEYIASSDVGVCTIENLSLKLYYALPNKIFEYILGGIPVVASDFPELRKVIGEYDVGCVVDPHNPKEIAAGVDSVLSDGERYSKMKENTKKALRVYNWENEGRKFLGLYEEL